MEDLLTNVELLEMLHSSLNIAKGTFKSWDDTVSEGYIVLDTDKLLDDRDETGVYFMETSLKLSHSEKKYNYFTTEFHKLIPLFTNKRTKLPDQFNTKELVNYIITNAMNDNWHYNRDKDDNFIPFTSADLYTLHKQEKTEKEIAEYEQHKQEVFNNIVAMEVPAEDKMWYELLEEEDMILDVFRVIRANRHNIRIVGEKDSFGWVTKGIELDGQLMCLI